MEKKPTFIFHDRVVTDENYINWLHEVKLRFRSSQVKAAVRVNTAMLEFYWSMGRDIVAILVSNLLTNLRCPKCLVLFHGFTMYRLSQRTD